MRDTVINLGLYQAGWFAMVLGAARGLPWLGAAGGLFLLTIHVLLSRERRPEILTVVTVGILGTLADSIQAHAGVFVFESGYWSYWVVPFWLTVMWMQFATLLHFALGWLSGRYLLSAVLGALGGPAAFWTGERLGGVIFPMGTLYSLLILGAAWFLLMPLCVFAADRFQPHRRPGRYRI
jgi:hypothetical protein